MSLVSKSTFQGQASDIAIQANEILKLRSQLNDLYALHTGQDLAEIRTMCLMPVLIIAIMHRGQDGARHVYVGRGGQAVWVDRRGVGAPRQAIFTVIALRDRRRAHSNIVQQTPCFVLRSHSSTSAGRRPTSAPLASHVQHVSQRTPARLVYYLNIVLRHSWRSVEGLEQHA